jgi:hypothetical protein
MLDFAHSLTLKAVDQGRAEDSPALRTLIETGLVEQRSDGGHVVTAAGRAALEEGEPRGWQRFLWPVIGACAGIYAVATIIQRVG